MSLIVGTNSYINVADADTYFEHAIHAAEWDAADTATKESALVTATRTLDRQNWKGTKYQDAQALEWPRSGVVDRNGDALDETTVPQAVLDATCELGLALIEDSSLQSNASTGSNIKKLKAGSAEIEYIRGTNGPRFPVIINELIGLWLSGGSSSYSGPFVSGADNETGFSGGFDLTRGY